MYADDTSVIMESNSVEGLEHQTNTVIQQFQNWCQKNSLIINLTKTVYIYFTHRVTPNIDQMVTSHETKFLGTNIDATLSFTSEIDNLGTKLGKANFQIINLKKEINRHGLISAYYSLVYSVLSYNIIWGQSSEIDRYSFRNIIKL